MHYSATEWLTAKLQMEAFERWRIRRGARRRRNLVEEARCGRHSGFRPCCVRFFCGPWQNVSRWSWARRWRYFESAVAYEAAHGWSGIQYIACPACIRTNAEPVAVRTCVYPARGRCRPLRPGEARPSYPASRGELPPEAKEAFGRLRAAVEARVKAARSVLPALA